MEGILTTENIISKKKVIKVADYSDRFYGYFLEKDNITYFVIDQKDDNLIKELPFKVKKYIETDYRGEVFRLITTVESIKIPSVKKMSFRELVDDVPHFEHTNPLHFKLFKIVSRAAYAERVNARIVTDAGFGKDSVMNINSYLVDSTANLYGGSFAKLEYVLKNNVIVLNEVGNLSKEGKYSMQEFFLAAGAYSNTYTKRTRKTSSTREEYDISKLSLVIFYNLPDYYISKGQDYFDTMFTSAVINRFIPFVFQGQITTKFEKIVDFKQVSLDSDRYYKDVISTINWYRDNPVTELKWDVPEIVKFPDYLSRYSRTFNTIIKYVSEYAESQEEFDELVTELYECYKEYDRQTGFAKDKFEKKETLL